MTRWDWRGKTWILHHVLIEFNLLFVLCLLVRDYSFVIFFLNSKFYLQFTENIFSKIETSNTTHVNYDFLFLVTHAMHKKINKYENFTFFLFNYEI